MDISLPKDVEKMSERVEALLVGESFKDSSLQLNYPGQLWGLIKDDFPEKDVQLHIRALYVNGKLLFRAETEPSRYNLEHLVEHFRSYGEGTRIFIDIVEKHGIDLEYQGNVVDLYAESERPVTSTPWVPLAVIGALFVLGILASASETE